MTDRYDPIDWQGTKKFLSGVSLGCEIFSAPEMPSTQIPAKEAARNGAPHGAVFVTDFQSSGRGRRDRGWHSVPGRDLMFSVVLRLGIERRHAPLLNLAAALAVARAVGRAAPDVPGVSIKWPNDVLAGEKKEKKICGIICESAGNDARLDYAVVGIGVNVNRTAEELPEPDSPDRPGATSLRVESEKTYDLPELLGLTLTELDGIVRMTETESGRRALADAYAVHCGTLGKIVRVVADDGAYRGIAARVSSDGALVVRTEAGEKIFHAADVVHIRPAEA
ncbi:biotin--[acetyl-CoA-carboxylase] ligase [Synergistaceae bacterium OttesenSCG-928-I11]|nr:biotin--[acetyl-CoA-carboxylase] ligase [Synergistaceae bacterium OttesenSCG-928-I11]